MWSKILTVLPSIFSFLANKSEANPKTALGTTGALAGLVGFLESPELQAALRNGFADILVAMAEAIRQVPSVGS